MDPKMANPSEKEKFPALRLFGCQLRFAKSTVLKTPRVINEGHNDFCGCQISFARRTLKEISRYFKDKSKRKHAPKQRR